MEQPNKRILSLALEALYTERGKINTEIATIEEQLKRQGKTEGKVLGTGKDRSSPERRKAVSEGMRKWWARRRAPSGKKTAKR